MSATSYFLIWEVLLTPNTQSAHAPSVPHSWEHPAAAPGEAEHPHGLCGHGHVVRRCRGAGGLASRWGDLHGASWGHIQDVQEQGYFS